ncbi:MAG: SURF1 family protein [Alphaproteobacteria bacterium]|nr:MAG: SURF1 family protein [Alphaproteobacteria bacterium]
MRRYLFPLAFGLIGVAILTALSVWQIQRLEWKRGVLAAIEARLTAPPVALPDRPRAERHAYLAVAFDGVLEDARIDVLTSIKRIGPGFRVIVPARIGERRILVDVGFVPEAARAAPLGLPRAVHVEGNLAWPDEVDSFTPAPDAATGIWFARDVPAMAEALGTEPVLVVARRITPALPQVTPQPVGTEGIPNNHAQYAITWALMALVWAGMSAYWIMRIRRGS